MTDKPVKFGYDEKIPENTREMFTILCQNLSRIQGKWDLYKVLFDSKNSDVLNDLASYAFMLIKDSLFEEIILGICRFGDNSIVFGHKTVGFKTLQTECGSVPGLDSKVTQFLSQYSPFKDRRDTHIAHTDYAVHIGDPNYHLWVDSQSLPIPTITVGMIDQILESCSQILATVSIHYSGADLYFHPVSGHGGKTLLYWLKYAHDSQKKEKE